MKYLWRTAALAAIVSLTLTGCGSGGTASLGSTANSTGTTSANTSSVFQEADGPEADTMEQFDLTAALLQKDKWNDAFDMCMTYHDNGVVQIGKETDTVSYTCYGDASGMFNKLVNMDIIFDCKSTLNTTNRLESYGQILFRGAEVSDMQKSNPCYLLEYEDNGDFSIRLGKYGPDGLSYLGLKVSIEAIYKPYEFNRMQVGFFNEENGVRALVYINGKLVINALDENPSEENKQAGHLFFQNGANNIYLRGVDSTAELPTVHPTPVKQVGDIQTYDISKMEEYTFRDLITVMSARTYTSSSGMPIFYRIYLPTNYSPDKKYPLAVWLHGAGLKGSDNLYQLAGDGNIYRAYLDYQQKEEFIFIVPQCTVMSWNENDYDLPEIWNDSQFPFSAKGKEATDIEKGVMELIAELQKEFSVDANRLYMSGASMGGMGTYGILARNPEMFAGAIVGCAAGDETMGAEYAKTPLVICHGALDPLILVDRGRKMRDVIEAAGGEVLYQEYADKYHDFTDRKEFYTSIDWMFSKTKAK